MRSLVLALAIIVLAAQAPASACQYTQRPEPVGEASADYFAKEMVAAASYVDLVIVEDDGVRGGDEADTGVITLRTLARFKGASTDRYTVFGQGLTASPYATDRGPPELLHFTSGTGQVTPFPYNEERPTALFARQLSSGEPPPPPPRMTSCSPPALAAKTGGFYLVMRDAEGRVMNRLTMSDGTNSVPNYRAYGFVPVGFSDDDVWLRAVRQVSTAGASGQTDLLYLRPGTDPVAAERTLRSRGTTIRAAYYRRGDIIEEVRPSPFEQDSGWLSRVPVFMAERDSRAIGSPAWTAAEDFQRELTMYQPYARDLQYEVADAFVRYLETARVTIEPRLVALEIDGDPHALAGEAFVERIAPLDRGPDGLRPFDGMTDAQTFERSIAIQRAIWGEIARNRSQ